MGKVHFGYKDHRDFSRAVKQSTLFMAAYPTSCLPRIHSTTKWNYDQVNLGNTADYTMRIAHERFVEVKYS